MLGFLSGPLGKLVILRILFGNGGGGGEGPAVPRGPFPTAKPEGLPPWPSGWCPDIPPPDEVQRRGWELLPTLWAKGQGTKLTEMTGGRYITYVAMMLDGIKGVAAYRSSNCEAVPAMPPPMPSATSYSPGVQAEQAADTAATALYREAVVMNEALKLRGYKKADMLIYKDFQKMAGLRADGYPGAVTMLKLETVLKSNGAQMAPVRVYPWRATGAYDGINAPTTAEWEGTSIPASSPIASTKATSPAPGAAPPVWSPAAVPASAYKPTTPPTFKPTVPYAPSSMTNTQVQHNLNLLGYKGADGVPLKEDGIIGPNSKYAIASFQRDHPPLAVDSIAGPQTKSTLAAAVALQQTQPSAAATPMYASAAAPTSPSVSTNVDVQHALNRLGYTGSNGQPLKEDGIIGPNSKYAIGRFQSEHPPLKVDQIAGPQTKAALSNALLSIAA